MGRKTKTLNSPVYTRLMTFVIISPSTFDVVLHLSSCFRRIKFLMLVSCKKIVPPSFEDLRILYSYCLQFQVNPGLLRLKLVSVENWRYLVSYKGDTYYAILPMFSGILHGSNVYMAKLQPYHQVPNPSCK